MKNLGLILTVAVLFLFAGVQVTSAQTKEKKAPVKTEQKVEKKVTKEATPEMKSATKEVKSKEKVAKVASTKGMKGKPKVKAHHMKHKTEKPAETPSK
jgi:cell division protein FtsL